MAVLSLTVRVKLSPNVSVREVPLDVVRDPPRNSTSSGGVGVVSRIPSR